MVATLFCRNPNATGTQDSEVLLWNSKISQGQMKHRLQDEQSRAADRPLNRTPSSTHASHTNARVTVLVKAEIKNK